MEPEVPAIFQRVRVVETVVDRGTRAKCEKVLGVLLAQAQDLDDDEADDLETLAQLINFRVVLRCFQEWVVLQREVPLDDGVPNTIREFVEKVLGLKTLCASRDWVMAHVFRQQSDSILVGLDRWIQNREREMGPDLVQEELQQAVADTLRTLLSQLSSTVRFASQAEAARAVFDWLTTAFTDECLRELQPPPVASARLDPGEHLEQELNTRFTNIRAKVDAEGDDAITALCEIYQELLPLQPHFATLENEVDAVQSLASEATSQSQSTDSSQSSQSTLRTREGASSVGQSSQWTLQVSTAALRTVPYTIPEHETAEVQELGGGHTLLHQVAMDGHLESVKTLLQESREDLNRQDYGGDTPLMLAAHHGHKDVVQFLCSQADCDLLLQNLQGITPLAEAWRQGHIDVAYTLSEKAKARNDPRILRWTKVPSPLEEAAILGHFEDMAVLAIDPVTSRPDWQSVTSIADSAGRLKAVKYLVEEEKVDVNTKDNDGETLLHQAVFQGHREVAQYLVDQANVDANTKNTHGRTPRHLAAQMGRLDVVKYLVEQANVDVNTKGKVGSTPLHTAAFQGHLAVVQYLVEQLLASPDANVDANTKDDNLGWTPLHWVASQGELEVVECLVEQAKVDVNTKDEEGLTPLHLAAKAGKVDVVKYLLEAQVDINSCDNNGLTPLHWVAHGGHLDVVKYLVKQVEVNVNAKSNNGLTPLHFAAGLGRLAVVTYLVEEAASWGRMEVTEYLVEANADVNAEDIDGDTPLDIVCCFLQEHKEPIESMLRAAGARSGRPQGTASSSR